MTAVKLDTFNNSWYHPGKNLMYRSLWYLANHLLLRSSIPGSFWRRGLLSLFGAKIGKKVVLKPRINIKYPWHLEIGDFTWIGENVWIDNLTLVEIGANCCVSQDAIFICGNHNYSSPSFDLLLKSIILKNGSWVGASSKVCPGVKMEENSILSMGSVAIGVLKENTIYQGNPAVEIKKRTIS